MQTKPLNRIIFTAGAALIATFLTFAATPVRAGIFDIPSEPADWNGPFVAFNGGGVWSNFDWHFNPTTVDLNKQYNIATGTTINGNFVPNNSSLVNLIDFLPTSHSSEDSAFIGGVDLGYNKQWGHFVGGFAFGFSGTHVDDVSSFRETEAGTIFVNPTTTNPGEVDYVSDFRDRRRIVQNWSGYAGGQVGFAWNRFLFYANGGAAFAQIDVHSFDRVDTFFIGVTDPLTGLTPASGENRQIRVVENNTMQTGWYAGGGMQFAFNNTVSAGIEYRHSDYGDTLYHFTTGPSALSPSATAIDYTTNSVLFKVTVLLGHLGEKAPAPAPGMTKK